ncbi:hypothetical protein [Sediminibacterium sp.]|uniref:hypothetical protein n=1 Tax=Sediminibacterium sp. TaxID=1917865 RepID=UPI00271DA2AC|nr:hypothetical protein [Sediminibacterium sp.]MDO9000357.1 hypothetical protein [Bacteroidota bacterium]MDP3147074.1 hypothetical protein [Bacteroidota bacterium]MDP3567389.1 hypothetical protein [Sediminibacterium sp.]
MCFISCTRNGKHENYVNTNFVNYRDVYNLFNDSLLTYLQSSIQEFKFVKEDKWLIDSFMIINSSKDKLISAVLVSSGVGYKGKSDWATMYFGIKKKGNWYFYQGGGSLIIPRDMYGKDENHPISFHELSQIARKEMFGEKCLIKKDGEWIVNDAWVDSYFYNNAYYSFGKHRVKGVVYPDEYFKMPRDKSKFDSVHWSIITSKWKHKFDTAEYKKQNKNY